MANVTNTAIRLYRRLFGAPPGSTLAEQGVDATVDANGAVALAEAMIAQVAVLGGAIPAAGADLVWRAELAQHGLNLYDELLTAQAAEGPRGIVAAAIGLALSGRRATAFLAGPDVAATEDLLASAAGRHLPLVLHLTNRSLPAHGSALGSGHEALYLSADSGFFVLFASNVQEAVDYTLIARRVAEQTLVPGLVVMDGEQTATAPQSARLPSRQQVQTFLGPADEIVETPTDAQKLLFGPTRRRVPRWHDVDRPVLQGALHGPDTFALGAAAQAYFDTHVAAALRESFEAFAERTGRRYDALSTYGLDDAEIVLVAEGAAAEIAWTVAGHLRRERKKRIGVLTVSCLRPFPGPEIVEYLRGKRTVAVLERARAPLTSDPPLLREVRASLHRAAANGTAGGAQGGMPAALADRERPRCHSVVYGLGGAPLLTADLMALVAELEGQARSRLYLGIDFRGEPGMHPKRQVLLDTLRRAYPELGELGLRGREPPPDPRPRGSLSVAVHRIAGQGFDAAALQIGVLLQRLEEGHIRGRPDSSSSPGCVDRITLSESPCAAPDDAPVEVAMVTHGADGRLHPHAGLREGGILLLRTQLNGEALLDSLAPDLAAAIVARKLTVFCIAHRDAAAAVPEPAGGENEGPRAVGLEREEPPEPTGLAAAAEATRQGRLELEHLLGALFGALRQTGLLKQRERRVLAARGIDFRDLPRDEREAFADAFHQGMKGVRAVPTGQLEPAAAQDRPLDPEAPAAVRHLGRDDDRYDSLPRFWDQIGVLHGRGETASLTPDPYLATGTIPPLSATFRDLSVGRGWLPRFDPVPCTGCARCWTCCPDSAIGVTSMGPEALLQTGVQLTGAEALRPIISQLATRIISEAGAGATEKATFGEMLRDAFAWVSERMTLTDERRQSLQAGIAGVDEAIGALPVAVTKPFFQDAEAVKKGGAELLSLVVNPDACKACGLCIEACDAGALEPTVQDAQVLAGAKKLWTTWVRTPDTKSETIERVAADPEIGSMAAVMLSRFCGMSMAGGDVAEAGSGEKLAIRMMLAAAEYQQQPLLHRFAQQVGETATEIANSIRATLVDALPTENLDALTRSLDRIEAQQVDLTTLVSRVENAAEDHPIDAAALRRSIDQARRLTDLHWRLAEGPNGLGRARFGLAVAPGSVAQWAGMFPYNPFDAPVVVDMTGDAAQLAAGLVVGQIRDTVEAVALLRRARLEIDKPAAADWQRAALDRLAWQDLDAEERRLCAPLFLVGDDDVLGGRGLAQVLWLLESGLPVKVLVLAQLDLGLASPPQAVTETAPIANPRSDLGLLALVQRGAYVAQTSIALPEHLHGCIRDALGFAGPAILRIHAPSPERHGFATDQTLAQARLAVDSRAFPVFRYHPEQEGVFGTRLSLDGNPSERDPWVVLDDESVLTPVSWAIKEQRFRACFRPLSSEDASPTELSDWLELDVRARRGKTPFISDGEGEAAVRYGVDPALAGKIAALAHSWRTLQELAGLVTPFTARVQEEAEARLAAGHEAELAALRQEHAEELEALRQKVELEMADRVREQLKTLALAAAPEDPEGVPRLGEAADDLPATSEQEGAEP